MCSLRVCLDVLLQLGRDRYFGYGLVDAAGAVMDLP
jgi:hypothetical protein